MTRTPLPLTRRAVVVALVFSALILAIEIAWHRPTFCPCGRIALWTGDPNGPDTSQQFADWYSLSHVIHGFLLYGLFWLALPGSARVWALPAAVLVEGAWELLENSPIIIDRYRAMTIAVGYSGDSILNSMGDVVMMTLGFVVARRLPFWATVALAIAFELLALAVMRDNLTLNVLMLTFPIDAIRVWQAGG